MKNDKFIKEVRKLIEFLEAPDLVMITDDTNEIFCYHTKELADLLVHLNIGLEEIGTHVEEPEARSTRVKEALPNDKGRN